jgi:acetylornithine aminotransferase
MAIAGGKGCELVDLEGKRYLDFAAGIATCTLGHANEKLAEAVSAQMRSVNHVSNLYYIPQQGELAKRLTDTCNLDKARRTPPGRTRTSRPAPPLILTMTRA